MRSRTIWTTSFSISASSAVTPALSTTNPRGIWPLSCRRRPSTAHSATSGMIGQHLLHAAGGEPVAGHVDDVVGAAHDEHVAVFVDIAGVGGLVVSRETLPGSFP
jgi:hypothetical protein